MKERFVSPKGLSIAIHILGAALGILCIVNAVLEILVFARDEFSFGEYYLYRGIAYGIFGALFIALVIYGFVKMKDAKKMAACSFFIGSCYCALEVVVSGITSVLLLVANSGGGGGFLYFVLYVLIAIVFLAAAYLMLKAGLRIRKDGQFRSAGSAGSIVFIIIAAIYFVAIIVSGFDAMSFILCLALLAMAILLLILSRKSDYLRETPVGEEKKIALLKEYKDLYDQGILTEEEYENKKKELL